MFNDYDLNILNKAFVNDLHRKQYFPLFLFCYLSYLIDALMYLFTIDLIYYIQSQGNMALSCKNDLYD